jgi:ABC-2 type transport system ATP-binding protein
VSSINVTTPADARVDDGLTSSAAATAPRTAPAWSKPGVVALSSAPTAIVPAAAEMMAAGRRFGDVIALEEVSLAVLPGSLVGVIGPSGAGKTTAVRLLTGGLRPTTGSVRALGEDPIAMRSVTRERIGFMPQQVSLYEDLTVAENLDFVASLFGSLMFARRRRIRQVIDWLDLTDARSRRASALSGGMQRRLQLGCALVHDPDLVFLDEPTAGIDPILRQTIWTELRRLRDEGRTLIVTTQYVQEAEECDAVALIAAGRLLAFAPPDELRRRAFGGELLEVETSGILEAAALGHHPLFEDVRQVGPCKLVMVTSDAAAATPQVVAAVEAAGSRVASIAESRPSFDEVFARLVERGER